MQVVGEAPVSASRWGSYAAVTVVVGLLSSLLIMGSYRALSHTWDEPTHLAAGMEAVQLHRYTIQTENPPLSRIPFALIPYLSGMRINPTDSRALSAGVNMLYRSGGYIGNVTKARLPNLFVFRLTLVMTWVLSGADPIPLSRLWRRPWLLPCRTSWRIRDWRRQTCHSCLHF